MKKLSKRKKIRFTICLSILFIAVAYGSTIAYRAWQLYSYAKGQTRDWYRRAHQYDAELGWAPIPGAESAHVFPVGPSVPMRYDENGFRVPCGDSRPSWRRPLLLALGCSFTYGDACLAEDTFPHKVAASLGGTEINAGVCSYGLAHMMILAERLIPKYEPEYVLLQYSPWLLPRATTYFAPTYFSYWPAPFFADSNGAALFIQPPVFSGYFVDLSPWRGTKRSPMDFLSFLFRTGVPLSLHDDFSILLFHARSAMGLIPQPTTKYNKVLATVYGAIRSTCSKYSSIPLLVVLGNSSKPVPLPPKISALGIDVVNAHAALLAALPAPTKNSYREAYGHFRGSPPVYVDGHPNPHAHTVIAEAILRSIRALPVPARRSQKQVQQSDSPGRESR